MELKSGVGGVAFFEKESESESESESQSQSQSFEETQTPILHKL